jgi:hypothetical protein
LQELLDETPGGFVGVVLLPLAALPIAYLARRKAGRCKRLLHRRLNGEPSIVHEISTAQ